MKNVLRKSLLVVLAILMTACAAATPAPEPTPIPPTATVEPTAAPVPPTATPEPTATAVPKPRLENLRFGTSATSDAAADTNTAFDFGVQTVFVRVDYADLPANSKLIWRFTGPHGDTEQSEVLSAPLGTAGLDLFGNPRAILPGKYTVAVRTYRLAASAVFTVEVNNLKPGTVIVAEPFNDNSLGWTLESSALGKTDIADGKLALSVNWKNQSVNTYIPVTLDDFDVTTDLLFEAGPENAAVSLNFWQIYSFDLFANGLCVVGKGSVQSYQPQLTMKCAPLFKPHDVNTVRIVTRGDRAAFYLNSTLIGSLVDSERVGSTIILSAMTLDSGGLIVSLDNVSVKVPPDQVAVMAVPTKAPTAVAPAATPKPAATKAPAAAPLADTIKRTRNAVEAIGGTMDRLYHGGGTESCVAFMESYVAIVNAPTYDVPANQQSAYAQYRQAVDFIAGSKVTQIANICLSGGGNIGSLDFNEARQAVNTAGSWLTQALAALGL